MNETDPAADDVAVEGDTSAPIEDNIKSRSTWLRGLFMCIYCVLFWLASIVGATVVIIGFFWVLFTGEKNTQLGQVGQGIPARPGNPQSPILHGEQAICLAFHDLRDPFRISSLCFGQIADRPE